MNKRIVLQYEEQVAFDRCKQDLLEQGYPEDVATQYAWDSHFAALRGAQDAKQLEMA